MTLVDKLLINADVKNEQSILTKKIIKGFSLTFVRLKFIFHRGVCLYATSKSLSVQTFIIHKSRKPHTVDRTISSDKEIFMRPFPVLYKEAEKKHTLKP